MATLNITEITDVGQNYVIGGPVAKIKSVTMQNVSFTTSQGRSSAVGTSCRLVRLFADAACAVKIGGSTVAAATTDVTMAASTPEYFLIDGGDYISAIAFS